MKRYSALIFLMALLVLIGFCHSGLSAQEASANSPAMATSCFKYEPALVTVSGTISIKQDFGPPNFGEDPAHDSKEDHLYIALDRPLCVEGDQNPRSLNQDGEADIRSMEMVYYDYPFQKGWLGKHVSVTGTLFEAITAHHHTPVLITAKETHILTDGEKSN